MEEMHVSSESRCETCGAQHLERASAGAASEQYAHILKVAQISNFYL